MLTAGLSLAGLGLVAGSLAPYFPDILEILWMLELGTYAHVHLFPKWLSPQWGADAFGSPMAKSRQ